jgi:hypothetical protein
MKIMQKFEGYESESIAYALAAGMVILTGEEDADRTSRRARWQRRKSSGKGGRS